MSENGDGFKPNAGQIAWLIMDGEPKKCSVAVWDVDGGDGVRVILAGNETPNYIERPVFYVSKGAALLFLMHDALEQMHRAVENVNRRTEAYLEHVRSL